MSNLPREWRYHGSSCTHGNALQATTIQAACNFACIEAFEDVYTAIVLHVTVLKQSMITRQKHEKVWPPSPAFALVTADQLILIQALTAAQQRNSELEGLLADAQAQLGCAVKHRKSAQQQLDAQEEDFERLGQRLKVLLPSSFHLPHPNLTVTPVLYPSILETFAKSPAAPHAPRSLS